MRRQSSNSKRLLLLLFLAGAAPLQTVNAQKSNSAPVSTPAVLPGFTVKLTYSQKAMETLVSRKETVIVAGYLYGLPKRGTPKRIVDEIGQVDVGKVKDEIAPGASATFNKIKPDQALLKWLDSDGIQLLINVYSGRKSSQENLIICDDYQGPLREIEGQIIPVSCKLIGE